MALNYNALKNMEPRLKVTRFRPKDTILYALGIGADELEFVFEEKLKALPMVAGVAGYPGFMWREESFEIDWKKILHVEQSIILHKALPPSGEYTGSTIIDRIVDKGADKGALIYSSREIFDENNNLVATANSVTMARGDGGFGGGDAAPPQREFPKDRPFDESLALPTAQNQAILYRLSGDLNPLHIDPEVAAAAGFDRPILHGMCTFGVAGRALLKILCGNDVEKFRSMSCRFTSPVFPGETIETQIWRDGDKAAFFRARVVERDIIVLGNGYCEFE